METGLAGIEIVPATGGDFRATEELARDAFWDLYRPGAVEHLVLHGLRESPEYLPELDRVARASGRIVGSILTTRAQVVDDGGAAQEVLCTGPLAVDASWRRFGIGAALFRDSIERASALGFRGIVIFGDPAYYARFGFTRAASFGIRTADGHDFDAFMALELRPGALKGVQGRFIASPAFEVDDDALAAFDRDFPPRDKHVLPGQLFG